MYGKLISLLLSMALSALAQDVKPDFSGTWELNEPSSLFGPAWERDQIDHKGPVLQITPQLPHQGDILITTAYVIDGKDQKRTFTGGEITRNARWEGRTLVIDTKTILHGVEKATHQTMDLSDDGKIMTRTIHFSGSEKKLDEKLIFDKVPSIGAVRMGQSIAVVKNAWGNPDKVIEMGPKTVFVYTQKQSDRRGGLFYLTETELIFIDGKLSDIRSKLVPRRSDRHPVDR